MRCKEVVCLWRVAGPDVPVKAVVAEVEGYTKRFTLVSSATDLTLLRLLQFRLEEAEGDSWWFHPPWNKRKARPSVLDLERLLRAQRGEIQQLLAAGLGT